MSVTRSAYVTWLCLLGAGIIAGLYTALRLFTTGHILFNANDIIMWTLPLGSYVFFALTSSGLALVSAIPLVFGVKKYEPLAKRLVFLSFATLCAAFVSIGLELGSLGHMIYIMLSPNLSSPIWYMGAIYSAELVFLLIKLWRLHVGDSRSLVSKTAGLGSFICALFGPLMIGSVFGITEARPTYFGSFMSLYCLLIAFVSGLALFLLYSMVYYSLSRGKVPDSESELFDDVSQRFGFVMAITLIFYLLRLALKSATSLPEFATEAHFELALTLIAPLVLICIRSIRSSTLVRIIASGIALVGIFGMHMEILISGQLRPVGPKAEGLPELLRYSPSVWEWMVVVFSLSIMLLLYTLGERFLKLEPSGN